MEKKFGSILASSQNPQELSLTIESTIKTIISVLALFASIKGIDPKAISQWYEPLVAQVSILVSAGFTIRYSINIVWGIIRKIIYFFFYK